MTSVTIAERNFVIEASRDRVKMGSFFRLFLLGQARRFAHSTFEAIQRLLVDLA
ncbi:MAG TPA: hypothetical protein VF372_02155 [Thermodesulfobacteriota bacterium]|jgi:hypothetical protein